MVRTERQKTTKQSERKLATNLIGTEYRLESHQGMYTNTESQRREIHANRNEIQETSLCKERFEAQSIYYDFPGSWKIFPVSIVFA